MADRLLRPVVEQWVGAIDKRRTDDGDALYGSLCDIILDIGHYARPLDAGILYPEQYRGLFLSGKP